MKLTINPTALHKLEHSNYPDILAVKQAQDILGVGRVSVYRLIESGQIEAFRIGRVYKVPKQSLIQFLKMRGELS